ncbi:hypothetical protein SAMN05443245_5235 [Paraburkholderia fungorum]|uniref:Uncharacterized protein n=1 Tax=Paraburkholderia fungorum TaxID=134537 RepID=A0A1H1IID5_9BURK|nr:hypothetical protein [Paraburkholderia fungorum]SDR37525.1 hypothetical protein SAMN05443245_5235 [Paraburkholderia fungorum]
MTPNSDNYDPTPEAVRALVDRIGKSQFWIATTIGISERRLRYLIAGSREVEGKETDVKITYPEQFALECLAQAAETLNQDRPRTVKFDRPTTSVDATGKRAINVKVRRSGID